MTQCSSLLLDLELAAGTTEEGPFVRAGRFESSLGAKPPAASALRSDFWRQDFTYRMARNETSTVVGPVDASGVKASAHARRVRLLSRFRYFFSNPTGRWSGISRSVDPVAGIPNHSDATQDAI
jgi:hypothetical protein